jgi:hypothetical protein
MLFLLVAPALRLCAVTALLPRERRRGTTAPTLPVDRIQWLVAVAGRRSWRRPTCLQEALVLAWVLRREGHATRLRIGVTRQGGRLQGHAWLEHDGRMLAGSPDSTTYTPMLTIAIPSGPS